MHVLFFFCLFGFFKKYFHKTEAGSAPVLLPHTPSPLTIGYILISPRPECGTLLSHHLTLQPRLWNSQQNRPKKEKNRTEVEQIPPLALTHISLFFLFLLKKGARAAPPPHLPVVDTGGVWLSPAVGALFCSEELNSSVRTRSTNTSSRV